MGVMELQCVVVYTVIDIAAPKVPSEPEVAPLDGCLAWIKGQIKRSHFNTLLSIFIDEIHLIIYLVINSITTKLKDE